MRGVAPGFCVKDSALHVTLRRIPASIPKVDGFWPFRSRRRSAAFSVSEGQKRI